MGGGQLPFPKATVITNAVLRHKTAELWDLKTGGIALGDYPGA